LLFRVKQELLGGEKNYTGKIRMCTTKNRMRQTNKCISGVKLHMARHFPNFIKLFGAPKIFDMIHVEHAHKSVKEAFNKTSKRDASTNMEVIKSLEITGLLEEALEVCEKEDARRGEPPIVTRDRSYRSLGYITGEGIAFEAYCTAVSSTRIWWNTTHNHFGVKQLGHPQFLNPKLTVRAISRQFEVNLSQIMSQRGEPDVFKRLQRNSDKCKLLMVRGFKMDSTTQGLPVQSIVCNMAEEETAGVRGRRQSRFDWVTISRGTNKYAF